MALSAVYESDIDTQGVEQDSTSQELNLSIFLVIPLISWVHIQNGTYRLRLRGIWFSLAVFTGYFPFFFH